MNTVSSMAEIKLDMMELKLDRLIEEMRFLNRARSHSIRACVGSRRISNRTNRANNSPKANPRRGSRPLPARRQGQLCLQSGQRSGWPDQALSGSMTRVLTVPGPPGRSYRAGSRCGALTSKPLAPFRADNRTDACWHYSTVPKAASSASG